MSEIVTSTNTNTMTAEAQALAAKKFNTFVSKYESKYPHLEIKRDSWLFDPKAGNGGKWSAEIKCPKCGEYHRRYTSDFHQAQLCAECKKESDKAKKAKTSSKVDPKDMSIEQLQALIATKTAAVEEPVGAEAGQ